MAVELSRKKRIEVGAQAIYKHLMGEDYEEFPWEPGDPPPSSETEREARLFSSLVVVALDEAEERVPTERPPVPPDVRNMLAGILTPGGIDQWWTNYLHLDPLASNGHAKEHARRFVHSLRHGSIGGR